MVAETNFIFDQSCPKIQIEKPFPSDSNYDSENNMPLIDQLISHLVDI